MYIYALSYVNPHHESRPFTLFLSTERLLNRDEAIRAAEEAIRADSLGLEMVEAARAGALCGPLEIDGQVRQPSIAVAVE